MREIKFRAWDIYSKPNRMVQPKEGDFIGWHSPSNWKDCYKIMQYTGLKDKNGKEVYEGDILRNIHDEKLLNWLVENKGFRFVIVNIGIDGYLGNHFTIDSTYFFCDREVIGNIYENPELLNLNP